MKLTNEFHDATTVEAMRKTLTHSTAKGIELKFYTIDGKVHMGKDILQLFSPVVRSMISAYSMILVEPKEFVFIMKDVRTSCLKNLRSLLANGRVNKLLTSSEIEEICVAGAMLGINLDNLSNDSLDANASQGKLNLPRTFFMNIKKESLQDLPPPAPILEDDTKDSSLSEINEHSPFDQGEYICSPPSTPLRVTLRKVHKTNSVDDATIPDTENLSVVAVETVSTPRSEIQESQSQRKGTLRKVIDSSRLKDGSIPETVAVSTPRSDIQESHSHPSNILDDQMLVDSDDSENETENNNANGVDIERPMIECGYCLFKTSDPKVLKQHKKDIHKQKSLKHNGSDKTNKRSTGYFCNKCAFETDQSSLAKQHSFDKPGHFYSKICLRCGKRHIDKKQCNFLPDVRCLECFKEGHVKSLHHPTYIKDYEVLKKLTIDMGIEIKKPFTSGGRGDKNMNLPRYSYQCETCPFKCYNQIQFRLHKCGEVTYNQRAPPPNVSGLRVQSSEPAAAAASEAQTTLCLICGGHHGPKCHFSITDQCAFKGCGESGHVETLHFPKNYSDYKTIKSFMPELLLSAIPQSQ